LGVAVTPALQTVFLFSGWTRVAIWTALVIGAVQLNASDLNSFCSAFGQEDGAKSASQTKQVVSRCEDKKQTSAKYDMTCIGQRRVGRGINLYSLEKERSLGKAMAASIDAQTIAVGDPKIKAYVSNLGQRLARNSDAQVPFTIRVIDSKIPTVFSLPGGFLYVDIALISAVDNEAQLAGLIAHEIAHVAARHTTRIATRNYSLDVFSLPVATMPAAILPRQIALTTAEKKFRRESEFEADLLGTEYLYAAGYDPQEYVEALETLDGQAIQKRARDSSLQSKPDFVDRMYRRIGQAFANYPLTELRVLKLQTEISKLPCRHDYVFNTSEFQEVKAQISAEQLVLHRRRPADSPTGPVLQRHPSSD